MKVLKREDGRGGGESYKGLGLQDVMFGNCKKKESHCEIHFGVEEDKYRASV